MSVVFQIEDAVRDFEGIWTNALSGKDSDPGSYMTVLSTKRLEDLIKKEEFKKEDWLKTSDYFKSIKVSPILRLTGIAIETYFLQKEIRENLEREDK